MNKVAERMSIRDRYPGSGCQVYGTKYREFVASVMIAVLGVTSLCVLGCTRDSPRLEMTVPVSALTPISGNTDLGIIMPGREVFEVIGLRNTTDQRLESLIVRSGCPCIVGQLPSKDVEPYGKVYLLLSVCPEETRDYSGAVNSKVLVQGEDRSDILSRLKVSVVVENTPELSSLLGKAATSKE